MRRLLIAVLGLFLLQGVIAADLPAPDAGVIRSSGVPVFEKAVFVTGNRDVGYRFATSESTAAVRDWYRGKLPAWSVLDKFGSWILYEGPAGAPLSKIMSGKQVSVVTNEKLPEWHKLPKALTTEIVIMIPK